MAPRPGEHRANGRNNYPTSCSYGAGRRETKAARSVTLKSLEVVLQRPPNRVTLSFSAEQLQLNFELRPICLDLHDMRVEPRFQPLVVVLIDGECVHSGGP